MSDWPLPSENLTLGARKEKAGVDPKRAVVEADAKTTSQPVGSPDQKNSDDFTITLATSRFLFR
jgi:hypothetical protein